MRGAKHATLKENRAAIMSPPRKATQRKPGSKSSTKGGSRRKSNARQSTRGDSLASKLKELRDRWVAISDLVDVTQAALEDGDAALIGESASSVLFNFVLTPMRDETRWLDELIEGIPEGAKS